MFNILFSSDILVSSSISFKIIMSMGAFVLGFNHINTFAQLRKLNQSILIVYLLLAFNFLISNVFKIGRGVYDDSGSFLVGNLRDNWNVFTYSLMLLPLLLLQFEKKSKIKYITIILFIICAIILFLSIKRTAIAGLVVGLLIYALLNLNLGKLLKRAVYIVVFIVLSFLLYGDLFLQRLDARSDRFESNAIEREGRYQETFYVWEEVLNFENPVKSIFGFEAFNSSGNYANGRFGERNLHVDYNLIVNTIGLFGLFLYLLFFYQIFRKFKLIKSKSKIPLFLYKPLIGVFFALFSVQFLTSFGGQMYAVTFRTIIFIYLGAILSILKSTHQTNESISSM